jgi:hypothetical protein
MPSYYRRSALGALVALSLFAAPHAWAGDLTVLLADGRQLDAVTMTSGADGNSVVLAPVKGDPVPAKAEELLAIDFGKVEGRPQPASVRFANGDQVVGTVSFPAARQVKVSGGWGSVTAPLTWCTAIRLNEKAALPAAVPRDTVVLGTDRLEGEIQGVAEGKVRIDVGGKLIPVELARVQSLALAPRNRPAAADATGLLLGLDLGGGERLTGRWVKLTPDVLTVRLDWGTNVDVPVASLSRLEVKNGKLVYLSDLKPAEARQTPYLDGTYPLQTDRSASGRPIRLGGKNYARGLGMHSRADVTYNLEGKYASFQATVGVDDAVGSEGSVLFRVYGDEKLLYEGPVARGGDKPVELKLDVKRVLLLRLEVDYADAGDVADHADWADARLLRE